MKSGDLGVLKQKAGGGERGFGHYFVTLQCETPPRDWLDTGSDQQIVGRSD